MPAPFRRSWLSALCAIALACATGAAQAQSAYPNKQIRIVVPFSAGGAVDTVARTLGERLSAEFGQPVIIDNRPGASANIGAEMVAKAAPDGYTLLVAANGLVTNITLFPNLTFNGLRDFAPISKIGYAPLVMVTNAEAPFKTLQDVITAGRGKADALTFGSAGNGSSGHLAGALLESVGKFDALHVPYKGGSPALVDLMGNRLSFMLLNPLEVLPNIQSGHLRALAVSADKRIAMLPTVPTMAEAGLPNFDASVWWMLLAPKGTPPEIVARLNAATQKALADADAKKRLNDLGAVVTPSTSAEAGTFLKSEYDKWATVIKAANITAE